MVLSQTLGLTIVKLTEKATNLFNKKGDVAQRLILIADVLECGPTTGSGRMIRESMAASLGRAREVVRLI